MPLITAAQCDSVRRAINATSKRKIPSDIVILDPIYAGQAEAEVRAVTADTEGAAVLAAIYICAALLLETGAVPDVVQETQGEVSFRKTNISADKRAAKLRERAAIQLDLTTPLPPTPVDITIRSDDFDHSTHVPVKGEW